VRWLACALLFACGGGAAPAPQAVTLPAPPVASEAPIPERAPEEPKGEAAPEVLARDRVTVVHFFASWCYPCKKSVPELAAIASRHPGVTVMGFAEDDDEGGARAFIASLAATFPFEWDARREHAGKWKPATMPTTYVIDRRGAVRFTHAGYRDGDAVQLEAEVRALEHER